ncbi:MAG: hypothetical protein AAGB29_01490 [Planctomycetota bacterium]
MHRSIAATTVLIGSLAAPIASANVIDITFQFLDLEYDGSVLETPGFFNDPLDAVTFRVDGVTVGTITSGVEANVNIPVVLPAPSSIPGSSMATSGAGNFDLIFGSDFLFLDVDEVEVTYLDTGTVKFVFGAETDASIAGQSLPFGLEIGEPVEISFSAQLSSGDFTGFVAEGTGEIVGIPEPSSLLLAGAAIGVIALPRRRRDG